MEGAPGWCSTPGVGFGAAGGFCSGCGCETCFFDLPNQLPKELLIFASLPTFQTNRILNGLLTLQLPQPLAGILDLLRVLGQGER